jgi:hypothetical protein
MWVVADLDDDYITKMEDVLELYEQPYDPPTPSGLLRREADHLARRPAASLAGDTGTGGAAG